MQAQEDSERGDRRRQTNAQSQRGLRLYKKSKLQPKGNVNVLLWSLFVAGLVSQVRERVSLKGRSETSYACCRGPPPLLPSSSSTTNCCNWLCDWPHERMQLPIWPWLQTVSSSAWGFFCHRFSLTSENACTVFYSPLTPSLCATLAAISDPFNHIHGLPWFA